MRFSVTFVFTARIRWGARFVAHEGPARLDGQRLPRPGLMVHLPGPLAIGNDRRHGQRGFLDVPRDVQELDRAPAHGFLRGPSVDFLRALVPVLDDVLHVANDDGIRCDVEEGRLLPQLLLRLLPRGDIVPDSYQPAYFARLVAQGHLRREEPAKASRGRLCRLVLVDLAGAGLNDEAIVGKEPLRHFAGDKLEIGLPDEIRRVAGSQEGGGGAVGEKEATLVVLDEDDIGQAVDECQEQGALLFQVLLQSDPLGDIPRYPQQADNGTCLVAQGQLQRIEITVLPSDIHQLR